MGEFLDFRGNVSTGEYRQILQDSHLGLCLKLPSSSMGATTFPSKVVELASNGLLVVSTKVSDVPLILDNSCAFLLGEATAQALANALTEIASHPEKSGATALKGQQKIAALLSEETVGAGLLQFWRGR
jgi:glycosyltransferase involved in cell wall biosynthesis